MGIVQSVFCAMTFCFERILTWICCAFVLIVLIFGILMLMVYGISVGYHYAQKELTDFAYYARAEPWEQYSLRSGQNQNEEGAGPMSLPVEDSGQSIDSRPVLAAYQTEKPEQQAYRRPPETPIVLLATERSRKDHEPGSHERELARKLIGRFRRSNNNITSQSSPFPKEYSDSTLPRDKRMAFI
ncbi:uncharacterized protein LOC118269271 [Spodoptera frugiperda]|uniref:Uncharacterized protein LOC118269271 n=1 Tax=Spodoptera frugiperda TaxID=7108 RepID=A0A9R0E2L6_SPOFR|nr:uncharacterized protein LOC118269271 [Spodoptera frugiperda]